jgi:phage terminase Nu1 subunit (DNA packaging protein)
MEAPETVNGTFLAKILGVHERTIRKLVAKRIVIRAARGKYDLIASVRIYDARKAAAAARQRTRGEDLDLELGDLDFS